MLTLSLIILIFCKALYFINKNLSYHFYLRISSIMLLLSSILIYNSLDLKGFIGTGIGLYGGLFQVSLSNQIIELLLLIIGSIILIAWPLKIDTNNNNSITLNNDLNKKDIYLNYSSNYSIILVFSSLGAILFLSCSDLISMYICIELQSFSLYILSTLFKDFSSSTSAGLKYFLIGGLASCLILLGSGLIYSSIGLTNFDSISTLLANQSLLDLKAFQLGIVVLLIGFLIKIAAAPLHNWSPDVYNSTPNIVTIWLTIIPKLSILIFLLELISILNINLISQENLMEYLVIENSYSNIHSIITEIWSNQLIKYLLLVVSLISLIIGGVVGLNQKHIKRLLAYSTISHLGFILLALSIYSEQSIESFIFYIIQYSITNLNIFLIIIGLSYLNWNSKLNNSYSKNLLNFNIKKTLDINLLSDFKGQFFSNPVLSVCFSICFFSLAGIPPLIGFFSKQFVLLSSIQEGYYFISIVAIIVSVISASYYLKVIKELYFESEEQITDQKGTELTKLYTENTNIENTNESSYYLSNTHSYIISVLTFIIIFFIFKPSLILNTSLIISLNIFPI